MNAARFDRSRFDPPGPKPWAMLVVALLALGFFVEFADLLALRKTPDGDGAGEGTPADAPATAGPLRATVSLPPVAGLVRMLGGDRWQVDSLVGPGQDPHVYEPTPRQVSALAASRLFFRTGMPFEDALAARAAAAHPDVRIVRLESAIHAAEDRDGGHGHDETDVHGWLSSVNLALWSTEIAANLAQADPAAAGGVLSRCADWKKALLAETEAAHEAVGRTGVRAFAAWHPAYGAWAAELGLEQIALEADGKSPGPRTLEAARERIAATGARTMLVQNGAEAARAAEFARGAGLRVAVVPPLGDDPLETLRFLREAVFGD